jgi:acyl dehydratase
VRGRCIEDIPAQVVLPPRILGPITAAHVVRWCAAIENWQRLHYDRSYATTRDGVPDVLINGSLKQQLLLQFVNHWVGEAGWVWKVTTRFLEMDVVGDTLTAMGTVKKTRYVGDWGEATVELGLWNQHGRRTTAATAITIWPRRGGPAVPYPFDPRRLDAEAASLERI